MKRWPIVLVIVAQVAVVAFMAAQREWIARTGAELTLRTAPIDPMDPMRGEFVRFRYEINTVPAELFRGRLQEWKKITDHRASRRLRDHVIYAALQVNPAGFAELVSAGDEPPATGPFLRGRVAFAHVGASGVEALDVRYGVESLFMQQGQARQLEDLARGERVGVPINTRIRVGRSGIAVLRDFEWEPLGITVQPDPLQPVPGRAAQPEPGPVRTPGITGVTVTLRNFGRAPLAIVDLPNGRSFRLRPDRGLQPVLFRWVHATSPELPEPRAADVIVLAPGEKHSVHLDLTDRYWWVQRADADVPTLPLRDVRDLWSARFRIEYVPPPASATGGLPHATLIRPVPVASRVFTAGAGVD
jgi:uncharacterized membrane-anchored protein